MQVELLQVLQSPHAPLTQTPSLGLSPIQDTVLDASGLGAGQALSSHAQLTDRVRVCVPCTPQAVALQGPSLHDPTVQAGLGQALVCVVAGLVDWSQSAPPQAAGEQVTMRLLVRLQIEPLQALQSPHAPVTQTPSTESRPVQERDVEPVHVLPPQAGAGLLQARVCVPLASQLVAEQALQSDQPPFTGSLPVQVRPDGPEQLPPHPGLGLSQVRVCVPAAPQAVAEQALQSDQPPAVGSLPVQALTSLVPRVPSSFRHSWPPCSGAGLLQVLVCRPAAPQAVAEQALQSDQPPSTSMSLPHFSEFEPPCWPSQRHRYMFELSGIAASFAVPAVQPLRTASLQTPSTATSDTRIPHFSEFLPPCWPSQRQRYMVALSASTSSFAVPAVQPLRTVSSQTPSTGTLDTRMAHFSELAPPCSPSQRQRYMVALSASASSFAVPAAQPLRTLSSQTPSTGTNLEHFSEFVPPSRPSQRHT